MIGKGWESKPKRYNRHELSRSKPTRDEEVSVRPPGYQPSLGRKLFMLGLCIVGLIVVWSVYFFNR
jgi:hypothetical protein